MSTPVFDPRAYAPAAFGRERAIVDFIRSEIAHVGRFDTNRSGRSTSALVARSRLLPRQDA
jgi:hypothetical protein